MTGKSDRVKGRVKEVAGILSGDKDLESEGKTDRLTGETQEKVDHAKDKVEEATDKTTNKIKEVAAKAKDALKRK